MNYKTAVKTYKLKREDYGYTPKGIQATRHTDLRNFDHPYVKDISKYDQLKFLVQLTRFEDAEYGYGCYGYTTEEMEIKKAVATYHEIRENVFPQKGRPSFNSINFIGIDENGKTFSVNEWTKEFEEKYPLEECR